METTKHLSEICNIAFPIEEDNKSSLMFVSGVHGLISKDSAPKHDDGPIYHNQSDNREINDFLSLEEKDRSMTELTISDCCSVRADGSNVNTDNVSDSCLISPLIFSDLFYQLPIKQNLDHLYSVKASEYFTASQTVQSFFPRKPGVNNNTHTSEEGALEILSSFQLQDEYSCSTPKEKHSYSDLSSKYAINPDTSWGVGGVNSRDAFREAPDGGEKQVNDGQVDPGQVQMILNQEESSDNFSESVQAHANALASRLMMQKTLSSSSSDFIDKLSLIDVEKYGLDSLISIPSPGPPNADQAGEKLDISPIIETIENCSSDFAAKNMHESWDESICDIGKDDTVPDIKGTYYSSENLEISEKNKNFPLSKQSRIPKLVQRSANKLAQSSVSSITPTINNFSNGSQNDRSLSKSISQSRSSSPDHLPSNMFSNPSTSVSLLSSAPIKHVNQKSGIQINKDMGRRCLSALALDSGMHTNLCDVKGKTNKPGGRLNRSSSVSMCSLPSSQKRANYTHVQSKVKQYIHNIKASQSRRASPSRSDTNSPCKTPTSSGPGNSIYLLNEDFLSEKNGALSDELQALLHQLEGASGDPQLLRTLFRVLMSERQTRSEHEHMLAAMQLSYDNLLATHARSQNLIDELRLQMTASHHGSCKRVYHPGFSSVNTSRASSPLHRQRRHSVTLGGHRTSSTGMGCLEELSLSQPNLIKETTCHVTETNLGISLDESGSMYLFPTPFESNSAIALLRTDEICKSGPNLTNESEESATSPRSHISNNWKYSNDNFNDPPQTYAKHTSPFSASTLPLNVSSVSDPLTHTNGKVQYVELRNRISLEQTPALQISSLQLLDPLGHKTDNFIQNELPYEGSAIPPSSAMSTFGDNSLGVLRAKLKDFAALLSCGALTKQETGDVWTELVTTYTHLIGAAGGSETVSTGAAMQLLACKFGLIPPLVGSKTSSVSGTKTQQVPGTCLPPTTRMTYERDTKLIQTAQERRLNHGLPIPKRSDRIDIQDTGKVADRREGVSHLKPDEDKLFDQKLLVKDVRTTSFDSSSDLQCAMSAVTALYEKKEGSKETYQSVEGTVSAAPNYFSSISAHDVSDNERVSESVQVPELDSIYTFNEDTSSLSAEDYSKYISVLKRLHWKLSRQEKTSKPNNKVTAEPSADYLSKIRSLNERIEQLCKGRNVCSSGSSTKLEPSAQPEADSSKTEPSTIRRHEENSDMNDCEERHEGHRASSRQNTTKTNLLTREAFASNDSLSPVSAREKVELWREQLVASVRDSETGGASYSKTAGRNCLARENARQEGALEAAQKNNSGILSATTKGDTNDGKPFTATSEWRYSIGEPRPKDNGPLSKRFDLDSGCPISDKSFRHLRSPHVNIQHDGRRKIDTSSEKSALDIDNVCPNIKCDDRSNCNTKPNVSLHDGFKIRPFVEEHYPRSHGPRKTVQTWESPLNNGRHHPMHGIDQTISDSDDRSLTSVATGNSKTYDKTVHETLFKLQRDVDLMKSKFLARTGTSGKTRSSVRYRRNLNDVRSPGKQVSSASRTPVRAVLAFPPSSSDSDAQSFVQEGHGGGVRRRFRRHEEVTTKRSQNLSDRSHTVQLSPEQPSRSCQRFNPPGNVDVPDSNHSLVSSSPRSTRKRKKRSQSCPRMVPGRSHCSTFVDNQPTCHCEPDPESGLRPSLPHLSDARCRCNLNDQYDAIAPHSHREYPHHQFCSSPLQFLQRSSSCRDLLSCSGLGGGSHWQDCINRNTRAGSGVRNAKIIYPMSLNNNATPRKWKSDLDVNKAKSGKYKLANHVDRENKVVYNTKRCTCDICHSCSCDKSYKSNFDFCDNCKPCCGRSISSNNLLLSLDTATAMADSVHARSRCLLVALRSRAAPLVETVVSDKGISAAPVAHTDVIAAVAQAAEVTCTNK